MRGIKHHTWILLVLAGIAAGLPAQAMKYRVPPLQELVCKSDIVVVGSLYVYLQSGIGITTTATGTDANNKPIRETMPPRHFDQGQISSYTAEANRFIKDDPWRDTSGGIVNVVLRSTTPYGVGMYPERVIRDKNRWLWLLHREHLLGQYYVLKQLPLAEEKTVTKILWEGKCGKGR